MADEHLVLLKDNQAKRCQWPMGDVINTFPSRDGKVRKVEIKVASVGTCKTFLRPVTETVLLLRNSNECSQRSYELRVTSYGRQAGSVLE